MLLQARDIVLCELKAGAEPPAIPLRRLNAANNGG
jgi:hypothetical protein